MKHQTRQWQHTQLLPGQDLPCCLCYCPKAQPQGGRNGAAESDAFTRPSWRFQFSCPSLNRVRHSVTLNLHDRCPDRPSSSLLDLFCESFCESLSWSEHQPLTALPGLKVPSSSVSFCFKPASQLPPALKQSKEAHGGLPDTKHRRFVSSITDIEPSKIHSQSSGSLKNK